MVSFLSNITLAPCYDLLSTRLLISSKNDPDDLALPLNGKKQNIRKKDFFEFGKNIGISEKVIQNTIESMSAYFSQWEQKIQKSFLNAELKGQFRELIKMRINILAL